MNDSVKLTKIMPQFVVLDVVKTAEYYRDMLGFSILGYFSDPPVYAMVARDGIEIHFGKAEGNGMKVNESVRRGLGHDAYIIVSDIDALHNEFVRSGVNIIEGPIKRVYGSTEITINDCNDFQLVFGD